MPMRKSIPRILAIDPGSKEMGIAFLEGEHDLVYHAVKSFRCERTQKVILREVRQAITRLISMFRPDTLVIERLYYIQQEGSPVLKRVYQELNAIGRKNGLKVIELAPNTIRKTIVDDGRATKLEVARILAHRFPQLQASLIEEKRKKWQQKYWLNMFDAVAAGLAWQKLKPETKRNCRI